jgi:hypothetical protein
MADQNPPPIEQRMEALLRNIAEDVRPCKACGAQLAMVRHRNGRLDKVEQFQIDIETHIEAGWLVIGVDVSEGETIRAAIDAYDAGSGVPE